VDLEPDHGFKRGHEFADCAIPGANRLLKTED
jgi:hypothetical protein